MRPIDADELKKKLIKECDPWDKWMLDRIDNAPTVEYPDVKEIIDVIHKTIYQFFDVYGDEEETPISDKDKLLLKVNKAICNNLKTLQHEGGSK